MHLNVSIKKTVTWHLTSGEKNFALMKQLLHAFNLKGTATFHVVSNWSLMTKWNKDITKLSKIKTK